MSFTVQELDEALRASDYYGDSPIVTLSWQGTTETTLGTLTKVDSWGPYGDGSSQEVVFKVEGDDRLFRKVGYYSSWEADSWDGPLDVVEPYQEIVTRYRAV